MTAHTQGPWTINTQADYPNPRIDGPNGRAVGHAIQRDPHPVTGQGITPAEALANARLMAAGPELLGAAIDAERAIDILLVSHHANKADAALESLRAAIAKATAA